MPRAGTTKGKIRKRYAAGEQKARLGRFLRRSGIIAGGTALVLWVGAWIVLSGAVPRLSHGAYKSFYTAAAGRGFVINNLLVEGRENTDPDVLRALLNVDRGDPIFAFDPAEAKDMIERISWVREAHVERRLPDTVYIGLVERVPMALWQNKGKVRLIDSDGITLADSRLEKFSDLIILVGEGAPRFAPDFIRLLNAEPSLKPRVEAASWVGERRWDLKMKSGAVVKMPEGDLGLALRRLAKAQEEDGLLDKDVEAIDLREEGRITVRTRPGAVMEYKAAINGDSI